MSAVIDKKSNLARGFADVHTPSEAAQELLMTYHNQRKDVLRRIDDIKSVLGSTPKTKQNKGIRKHLVEKLEIQLDIYRKLKEKRRLDVNPDSFLVQRLKKIIDPEIFYPQAKLAQLDAKAVLEELCVDVHSTTKNKEES